MATNNYYFKCEKETEKAAKKMKKKKFFAALGGVLVAGAGVALAYKKGFGNGADAMQSAAQQKLNDAFTAGVIGGYSRAGIDFGKFTKDDAPNLVNTLVSEMTSSGYLTEGVLTSEEIDRLVEATIATQ